MRYTEILMENGALPETKKLRISGYLGEISTEQFVYFTVEMTDEAALELRDGITALFGLNCPECAVSEPVIRNPLALSDDALGENHAPAALNNPLPMGVREPGLHAVQSNESVPPEGFGPSTQKAIDNAQVAHRQYRQDAVPQADGDSGYPPYAVDRH